MKVLLFGQFRIEGGVEPIRLSAAKRLIAVLCTKPGLRWPREQLALAVWPTLDDASCRDRLRSTLADARRALGSSVDWAGGRNYLELIPIHLDVDLWEAQSVVRRVTTAIDTVAEAQALSSLVHRISGPLLEDMPEFMIAERDEWNHRKVSALIRLAAIAEESNNAEDSCNFLEQALQISPHDERLWTSLIRITAQLGRHVEIYERFARVRRDLRNSMGIDFSASLRQFVQQAKRTGHTAAILTAEQSAMVANTFARQLDTASLRAAEILGSDEFRLEVFRSPTAAADLLDQLLTATGGASTARMKCAVHSMMAHTLTGREDRLIAIGQEVVRSDRDPTRLRAAETMLAGAYQNQGKFELALSSYESALTHAIAVGNMPGIDLVLAQRVVIEWELGAGSDCALVLTEIEERLGLYDEHNARVGRATVNGYIGLIHLYEDDARAAKKWFERCIGLARASGHTAAATSMQPGLGLAQILLGETTDGVHLLRKGLADVYRLKSDRQTLRTLDLCARGLVHAGQGARALAVMGNAQLLRERENIATSPIHQSYCERVRSLIGSREPDSSAGSAASVRELVSNTVSLLQEISPSGSI